jgi:hypothetical protein
MEIMVVPLSVARIKQTPGAKVLISEKQMLAVVIVIIFLVS